MPTRKQNIVLVDGYSLAYRAFYALPKFETRSGHPTGATYGFFSMIWKIIEDFEPFTVLVAFDYPQKTFRHIMREEYKAHRKPTPDDLKSQFQDIKDLIGVLGFDWRAEPGYEADDIIGSLNHAASRLGPVTIISSDLDMMQLVKGHTVLLRPVKGLSTMKCLDRVTIVQEMGIEPEQVIDLIAMAGDPSDNIIGIPGIGKKTAVRYLRTYYDWKGILAHLDQLPHRHGQAINQAREQVEENRKLATIKTDLPVTVDWRKWERQDIKWDVLLDKLDMLDFRTLKERVLKTESHLSDPAEPPGDHQEKTHNPSRGKYLLFRKGESVFFQDNGEMVTNEVVMENRENHLVQSSRESLIGYCPVLENTGVLETWLENGPTTFINAETILFLTHPSVCFEMSTMVLDERRDRSTLLSMLGHYLARSHRWLERNPELFDIYRMVEIPLLRYLLQKYPREVYSPGSPFSGVANLSDLPLFRSQLSQTMIILPERSLLFQARFGIGDDQDNSEEHDGLRAFQTLYGRRFLVKDTTAEQRNISALRQTTCWRELERIVGLMMYQAGAHQVHSCPNGLSFTCSDQPPRELIEKIEHSLVDSPYLALSLGLDKQGEHCYVVRIR